MRIINDNRDRIGDYVEVYRVGDRILGRTAGDKAGSFTVLASYDSVSVAEASLEDFFKYTADFGALPDNIYKFVKVPRL